MARPDDLDLEFMENSLARNLDIVHLADRIIEVSDEPAIIKLSLRIIRKAKTQQACWIGFWPRMRDLKEKEDRLTVEDKQQAGLGT